MAGYAEGDPIAARADSVVVETNLHCPTNLSLRWDAGRCLVRTAAALSKAWEVPGWRQHQQWQQGLKQVRTANLRSGSKREARRAERWSWECR